jgi:hypothetical protein
MSLIENCLLHLQFELFRESPSYFRIAREAHLLFYRSMIEALRGTANLTITGRRSKDRRYKYKRNGKPWQEIYKISIEGKKAWRFCQPIPCEEQQFGAEYLQNIKTEDYLIHFYDALAMIQTECFMNQYGHSRIFAVSDSDMNVFEWLHEEIRNEYEHFVPKIYLSPIQALVSAAKLCISLSKDLLFESGNVIFYDIAEDKFKQLFLQIKL